jgi:hypothetical protein
MTSREAGANITDIIGPAFYELFWDVVEEKHTPLPSGRRARVFEVLFCRQRRYRTASCATRNGD